MSAALKDGVRDDGTIDPVWPMQGGYLLPIAWEHAALSAHARAVIEAVRACPSAHASVFLRGSTVEQPNPHKQADIDLLLLGDGTGSPWISIDALRSFGRFVDVVAIIAQGPRSDPALHLLSQVRALLVCGTPATQEPVKLDRSLLLAHWRRYDPGGLPGELTSAGLQRVAEVKRLVRSAGLVSTLRTGQFTRDLGTCLAWAEEEGPIGPELRAIAATMEDPRPCEVRRVQAWLREQFFARLAAWR